MKRIIGNKEAKYFCFSVVVVVVVAVVVVVVDFAVVVVPRKDVVKLFLVVFRLLGPNDLPKSFHLLSI